MEETTASLVQPGRLAIRLIAAMLALLIFASTLLAYASRIDFSSAAFGEGAAGEAAQYVEDNTGYLSEDQVSRIWELMKTWGEATTYEDYDLRASVAIAKEQYADAIEYMQGCIRLFPGDASGAGLAELHVKLGCLYALNADMQSALRELSTAATLNAQDAQTFLLRAQIYAELNQAEATLRDIERYIELEGRVIPILAAAAPVYESIGEYAKAIDCYTEALNSAEDFDMTYYVGRARSRLMAADYAGAYEDLTAYFDLEGTDETGSINAMYGVAAMNQGHFDIATEAFHAAVEAGYSQPELLYSQAVLSAYVAGDYATVIRDGEAAIALLTQPVQDDAEAIGDAGASGDSEAASEAASAASGADVSQLYQWVGLAHLGLEQFAQAEERLTSCIELQPDTQDVYYYRGVARTGTENYNGAIEDFVLSIEKGESVSASYYNRAVCYLNQEEYTQAAYDLIAVMERDDDPQLTQAASDLLSQFTTWESNTPADTSD